MSGIATHLIPSLLQPIPRFEHPPHNEQTNTQEYQHHGKAHSHANIGDFKKAPPESADQINHRIEQSDGLPRRWQHINRIKATAQKDQRRNHQHRDELQFFEIGGP